MFAIEQDSWLTQTMGCAAYRVDPGGVGDIIATSLNGRQFASAIQAPGFYYCKVETSRVAVCHQLESHGFRLVDSNISLEAEVGQIDAKSSGSVRLASSEDRDAVMQVARTAFTQSRFHLDPGIPTAVANEIKAAWAGNYFAGSRGQFMVVAELHGEMAGFMQLLSHPEQGLTIDLIGVDTAARGKGLGRAMIAYALVACGSPTRLRVGTQAANVRSLRFYETLGFRVTASSFVFHLHRHS